MFGYEVSTLIVHSIKSYVRPLSLAWCELYLVFGNLFRKLDMEIYKTRSAISPLFPIFRHRSFCTVRKIYLSGVIFCLYFAVDIYMLPLETVDSQVDLA